MAFKVKSNKKVYLLVALALVLVVVLGVVFKKDQKVTTTKIQSTSPAASKSSDSASPKSAGTNNATSDNSDASSKDSQASTGSAQAQSATLIAPFGSFVSNHSPGQNGSPTSEASACNTSPGATCYIQFTKGSSVKKLDAKITDSNGSAIWYWDVNSAGFTKGSWQISAVATLNGSTKTSQDNAPLEVQ